MCFDMWLCMIFHRHMMPDEEDLLLHELVSESYEPEVFWQDDNPYYVKQPKKYMNKKIKIE